MAVFAPLFADLTGHPPNEQYRETGLTAGRPAACPEQRRSGSAPTTSAATSWSGSPTAPGSRCSSAWSPPLLTVVDRRRRRPRGRLPRRHRRHAPRPAHRRRAVASRSCWSRSRWCRSPGPSLTVTVLRHRVLQLGVGGPHRPRSGAVASASGSSSRRRGRSAPATRRIMFVDILPNVLAPVIVYTTLLIPVVIVVEATLSFLGLACRRRPPTGAA